MTSTTTPRRAALLSNREAITRTLGALRWAADQDRMDPEPCALLYLDLTARDADRLLAAGRAAGDHSEWLEDFTAAVKWNAAYGG